MMKVAIIAAAASPHTMKWANALAERENRVTVFSLPENKAEHTEFASEVSINYLGVPQAGGGVKKNASELKRMLSAGDFDAVLAIGALDYGVMAARAARRFAVIILGPDIVSATEGAQKGPIKKVLGAAGAIICPSAAAMQQVRSVYKKDKEIFIVPPGVNIYDFDKKEVEKEEGVFTIGCLKTLENASGIDFLIEAYAKFKESYEGKSQVKIYGQGSMEAALKKQCADAGLISDVHFMGVVPHSRIPEEINKMDVLVNASRNEIFGVSTVEAMACKVPVIATDTGGSSEIILNGVTGFTVKVGNTGAIAERLLEFAENSDLKDNMGEKARGDAEELYEINKCVEKFIKALAAVQK
jgi:glycosyltransferase involved in cell wall biosynthesis